MKLREIRLQLRNALVIIHQEDKKPVAFKLKGFSGHISKLPQYRLLANKECLGDDLFRLYGEKEVKKIWQGENKTLCVEVS